MRVNKAGELKTINYGEVTSMNNDPIEKKPLYHFKPGANVLSVGSFGCNFSCGFCQNYSIAQYRAESKYVSPENLIEFCCSLKDNIGIAFTYNEPSIWYEYIYETSKKLKEKYPELNVILVTNGYIQIRPLEKLLHYVDAMNIDLKSFQNDYYKKVCSGDLESVLKTIERAHNECHIEITTLMVNNLNDSKEEIREVASFLGSLDRNIPLHLTRYFPSYKMDRPPTEIDQILRGREVAEEYLNYVYIGNVMGIDNSTYCPKCNELLIERGGLSPKIRLKDNRCPQCGHKINYLIIK